MFKVDEPTFQLAWKLFKEQGRPYLSFTDCVNVATCRLNGISKIATFDRAFSKVEGLTVVGP